MNERSLFLKDALKKALNLLPFAVTQNQHYDRETKAVIRRLCRPDSNCVDVGTHRGEILDIMRAAAPKGTHFGFEPLPQFFKRLEAKYRHAARIHVFPYALSTEAGTASFNHVKTNPAYSGLQKRSYDRAGELDETITVETRRLDEVLQPFDLPVQLMKIDVEGGELGVLRGAEALLRRDHPVIIFEFGIGGSDHYGTTPKVLLDFLEPLGYRVSLMKRYLEGKPHFTLKELEGQFYGKKNFYFIAYP
jgi:FkbM family methyltransferase